MKNINFASRPYFSEQGNVDDDATFITIFFVSFNLQSCCLMQSAVCSLQSTVCGLQSANVIHPSSRNCFESFEYSEKRIASIHNRSQEFFTFTCVHRLSTQNRIPPPLVFYCFFSTVECSLGYKQYLVLRSHNNKTRGGLGRVCATGMYRSIEHVKFPKFQTGIFVEWKAPQCFAVSHFKVIADCSAVYTPRFLDMIRRS